LPRLDAAPPAARAVAALHLLARVQLVARTERGEARAHRRLVARGAKDGDRNRNAVDVAGTRQHDAFDDDLLAVEHRRENGGGVALDVADLSAENIQHLDRIAVVRIVRLAHQLDLLAVLDTTFIVLNALDVTIEHAQQNIVDAIVVVVLIVLIVDIGQIKHRTASSGTTDGTDCSELPELRRPF
jgi:hypothetical protein